MNLEGHQLGEFEILERLGRGGMGAVYKARQASLDRFVAVKALQTSLAEDADFITRFRQEAKAAAGLIHPNLVQVYSAGESDGIHWFAMEYVAGESARARLERKRRLNPKEGIAIAINVATALEYGWRKARLIHRDVKPDNIFLSGDGEVKLGDLGLAKSAGRADGLTTTGASMGTPHYISPEQAVASKNVDLRADIYSLGCTLFHFLSGKPPFDGNGAVAIMMQHANGPVPMLETTWPGCPPVLNEVVARMMQKDPARRQRDYATVISDLWQAYEVTSDQDGPPMAVPEPAPQSPAVPPAEAAAKGYSFLPRPARPQEVPPARAAAKAPIANVSQPGGGTIANLTKLGKETTIPFILKHAPSYGPVDAQRICDGLWNATSGSVRSTIYTAADRIFIVLSKVARNPTALGGTFSTSPGGWIWVPAELIARWLKPGDPVSKEFQESLDRCYRVISSKLYSTGDCCALFQLENGNGMRVDVKEDPKHREVLLYKTKLLPVRSYSVSEFEPEMVFAWREVGGVQTNSHGEVRSDGWLTFELIRCLEEIESAGAGEVMKNWIAPPPAALPPAPAPAKGFWKWMGSKLSQAASPGKPAATESMAARFSGTWKGKIDPGTGAMPGALVTYKMFPKKKQTFVEVSHTGFHMTEKVDLINNPFSGNTLRAGGFEFTVQPNARFGHFKIHQTIFNHGLKEIKKLGEGTLRRV